MTSWAMRLLAANVAMYFVTMVLPDVARALILVPVLIPSRPWTVVTYMFLHAGLMHLAFNMIALYFFGPRLEARLGGRRFLALYFVSGLVAAIASLLTPTAAIVGASGAVYGVMLGFARYWPNERIYIWGVLPVTARWLVIGMTVLSLWGGLGGAGRGIAHFAHLGGFLGGLIYLFWSERHSPAARFKARATPRASPGSGADVERWARIRPDDLHPVNRDEVTRLLQKIALGTPASLTAEERAFLDRMSAR